MMIYRQLLSKKTLIARTLSIVIGHLAQHVVVIARSVRVQVFVALQDASSLLIFVENCGYLHFFVLFGDSQGVV